jgi:hypothetical protein
LADGSDGAALAEKAKAARRSGLVDSFMVLLSFSFWFWAWSGLQGVGENTNLQRSKLLQTLPIAGLFPSFNTEPRDIEAPHSPCIFSEIY